MVLPLRVCVTMEYQEWAIAGYRIKTRRVHRSEPYDVYIGRPGPWGNPWSSKPGPKADMRAKDRAEAIAAHRAWVLSQPLMLKRIREELRGKVLGCWCRPGQACHGDVLVEVADGRRLQVQSSIEDYKH